MGNRYHAAARSDQSLRVRSPLAAAMAAGEHPRPAARPQVPTGAEAAVVVAMVAEPTTRVPW